MKRLFLLVFVFSLTGCASVKELITVKDTQYVSLDVIHPPAPPAAKVDYVTWDVVTSLNYKEKFEKPDAVYYALTPEEFKKIHDNIQELIAYTFSLRANNEHYKTTIADQKQKVEDMNKKKE